ncbi:MAG TPA: PAS domain S-box protein [Methylomirabilota bacterium]|nr:PAS domain S-box protein [Methylomirabilota bacterium]
MGAAGPRFAARFGVAVLCVTAAVLVRMALDSLWVLTFPYLTLTPAIMGAAWFGGLGPGLLATALCGLIATYFWIAPIHTFWIEGVGPGVSMALFLFVGVTISVLSELVHRRERHLTTIVESISDGFAVLDRDWRYRFLNEEAARLARRPRRELIGRRIWDIMPDLVGTAFEHEARRAAADRAPTRVELYQPSQAAWLELRMFPSSEGLAVYFEDISARKRDEHLSARLAAIVTSSDDAIISKDLDGTIMSWNPGAERIFGYRSDEAIGRHITMIIPPERRSEEDTVLARIRAGQTVHHFETVRVHKDGHPIDISLTVSPIRNAAGRAVGASKIARDITEQKRIQRDRDQLLVRERAARSQAEAGNRAKDEFLTTLSHELRTPLNAVYGWAAMLQSGGLDQAAFTKAVDAIMRNANAQVQLIDDLLDVSRITAGKLRLDVQSMDLAPVVEAALDATRPAAAAKSIHLETVLDPRAGPITGDPNRLQQVVWNLLSNAVKFTPRNGRVQVHLQRINSHVEIVVSDTGSGIAPDLLPFVFDRFRQGDNSSTRTHGGLGLGLTLVKQLVELHGGTVRAASRGVGKGATFTVTLPVNVALVLAGSVEREHPSAGRLPVAAPLVRLDGLRVLVADDDADGLGLIAEILGRAGAVVETSTSAPRAFEQFQARPPDVLVSDIEMPDEDGYGLIRRIRALEPARGGRTPAIALTAYGRREDRLRAISAGFTMHIPKPVDPAELTTLVASLAAN